MSALVRPIAVPPPNGHQDRASFARSQQGTTSASGSAAAGIGARLAPGVRLRNEPFGAIIYVPSRDHFYALDHQYAAIIGRLREEMIPLAAGDVVRARVLAHLGASITTDATPQRAFYGRSHVGTLTSTPLSGRPLVVNCFTTSHCPLRCAYCHADDLMVNYRDREQESWLQTVMRTARITPAMVGVVTGGEPISRPSRAEALIDSLAASKAVVLDTSGMGDIAALMPALIRNNVHVRVSIDSADARIHDAVRPINRRYLALGTSAHWFAEDAVRRVIAEGLSCSVQTVVTRGNGDLSRLLELRDRLIQLGVTTWVIHALVSAGKAAGQNGSRLASRSDVADTLKQLVCHTAAERSPIDIRVTNTGRARNSVVLISAEGEFSVEKSDGSGKMLFPLPDGATEKDTVRLFREHVDLAGHAERYLNGALDTYTDQPGAELPRGRHN